MTAADPILLDGAIGTELIARGLDADTPAWTASANLDHPELVVSVHRAYSEAGAEVHTANTFRATPSAMGDRWREALVAGVEHARAGGAPGGRVVGSIGPVEDCYRPDRSPGAGGRAHFDALAAAFVDAGVDAVLCETFPRIDECAACVDACVGAGLPCWASLTPGPDGSLLTASEVGEGARLLAGRGAALVCVNCVGIEVAAPFVRELASTGLPYGFFANAGGREAGLGWGAEGGASRFCSIVGGLMGPGVGLIGGCCGTGPEHIQAIRGLLATRSGG